VSFFLRKFVMEVGSREKKSENSYCKGLMRVDFYIILNNYREVYQSFQKALQGARILQYGHGIEIRNKN